MIFRSRYSIGKLSKVSTQSMGARYQVRRNRNKKFLAIGKTLFLFCFSLGIIGSIVLGIIIWNMSKTLPDVEAISTYIPAETTKIYSEDGVVLAQLHLEENRVLIPHRTYFTHIARNRCRNRRQ